MEHNDAAELKRAKARERQRKHRANLSAEKKHAIRREDSIRHKKSLEDERAHSICKQRAICLQKSRLLDAEKHEQHKQRLKTSQEKRLTDPAKQAEHKLRNLQSQRIRFTDPDKHEEHKRRNLATQQKRLIDHDKHEEQKRRNLATQQKRLIDPDKHEEQKRRNLATQQKRLIDPDKHEEQKRRNLATQQKRLINPDKHEEHKRRNLATQQKRLIDPDKHEEQKRRNLVSQQKRFPDPDKHEEQKRRNLVSQQKRLKDPAVHAKHKERLISSQMKRLSNPIMHSIHKHRLLFAQRHRLSDLLIRRAHIERTLATRRKRILSINARTVKIQSKVPLAILLSIQGGKNGLKMNRRALCNQCDLEWSELVGIWPTVRKYTHSAKILKNISPELSKNKHTMDLHTIVSLAVIKEMLIENKPESRASDIAERYKLIYERNSKNFLIYSEVLRAIQSIKNKLLSSVSLSSTCINAKNRDVVELIAIGGLHVHIKDLDKQKNIAGQRVYRSADHVFPDAAQRARSSLYGSQTSTLTTLPEATLCSQSEICENKFALGDEFCPVYPSSWTKTVRSIVESLCATPTIRLWNEISSIRCPRCSVSLCKAEEIDKCSDIKHILSTLSLCFTHVRTIKRTFQELSEYLRWVTEFQRLRAQKDIQGMSSLCLDLTPRLIKLKHSSVDLVDESHHFEQNAMKRFGRQISAFKNEEKNIAVYDCFSCRRIFKKSELSPIATDLPGITNIIGSAVLGNLTTIDVCTECKSNLKKGEIPPLCFKNGLDFDTIPPELQNLNFVEIACLRIVRPFLNMVKLSPLSHGGRGMGHSGYEGTLLLLPSSPQNTVEHVMKNSECLPSPRNMRLHVDGGKCGNWKSICRFEKVLQAVEWLKINNPLYANLRLANRTEFEQMMNAVVEGDPNLEASQLFTEASQGPPSIASDAPSLSGSHVLTQIVPVAMAAKDPIHSIGTALEAYRNYEAVRNDGQRINILEENLELKVFPHLFVSGNFGFLHKRAKKLSDTKFLRFLLNHRDRRFVDKELLFYMHDRKEQKHVRGCVYFQSTKKLGTRELREMIDSGENIDASVSSMFSHLKSHESYWRRVRSDLACLIKYLGPPTWFITLNPAESEWKPLHDLYRARHPHVNFSNIYSSTLADTVLFCKYFYDRIRNCLANLLMGESGVLGNGIHYWFRIEYQSRGAPHVHMVIWIRGAPQLNDAAFTEADIIKYIDAHVTTRMPDAALEPEAHRLVKRFMQHQCTSTCTMKKKRQIPNLSSCRFGFPLPVSSTTKLTTPEEKQKYPHIRSYILRRGSSQQWQNAVNIPLLLAWRGNLDLQFLGEGSAAIIQYVTAYVGKSESKNSLSFDDFGKNMSGKSLHEYASLALRSRQLGLPEVCDHLLGHPAHRSTAAVLFLNLDPEENRTRVLKNFRALGGDAQEESSTLPNMLDVYYPKRPSELDNCSLFSFAYSMRLTKKKPTGKIIVGEDDDVAFDVGCAEDSITSWLSEKGYDTKSLDSPFNRRRSGTTYCLQNGYGYAIVKTKPTLVKYFVPAVSAENEEEEEDYYRRYLLLFKPFRVESEIKANTESFKSSFEAFFQQCTPGAQQSMRRLISYDKSTSSHVVSNRERKEAMQKIVEDEEENDAPFLGSYNLTMDIQQIAATLNEEQLQTFTIIMDNLERKEKQESFNNCFVAGIAGCGKSHVIKALTKAVQYRYQKSEDPTVVVAAPTGLAALNVDGTTVHSLFRIEVEKRKTAGVRNLSGKNLELSRGLFKEVRVIIIDEASMISNVMLWKLNLRCQEIAGVYDKAFGGYLLVLFGDLLQLPPVRLAPIYERLISSHSRAIFGISTLGYHLWRESFMFRELTRNMRQNGDMTFAELLSRFRLGMLTSEDISLIEGRRIEKIIGKEPPFSGATLEMVVSYYQKIAITDPRVLCLFGRTACVEATNMKIMELRLREDPNLEIETIAALESQDVRVLKSGSKFWLRKGLRLTDILKNRNQECIQLVDDALETSVQTKQRGGLPKHLRLQVGARIMLLRNIDQTNKLVNGVLGNIVKFIRDCDNSIVRLQIKFDHLENDVFIDRLKTVYELSAKLQTIKIRHQFPVAVAFAVTVHKSQGQTLDNVIVDLCTSFSAGQLYVAASRTRSLAGLHVMNFDPHSIIVSKSAVSEYNRNRAVLNLDPLPLPQPSRAKKCQWINSFLGTAEPSVAGTKRALPPAKNATRVKRPRVNSLRSDRTRALLLTNLGTDCCFNSVVQSLRVLACLHRITTANSIWSIIMRLRTAYGRHSTGSLREDMGVAQKYYTEILQCIASLNAYDQSLFEFNERTEGLCSLCGNQRTNVVEEKILSLPTPSCEGATSISDLFRTHTSHVFISNCNLCGSDTFEELRSLDLSNNQILIVTLPVFAHQADRRRDVKLPNQHDSIVLIGDQTWRVRAAIIHTGHTRIAGHYTVITSHENRWTLHDDARAPTSSRQHFCDYDGVCLVVLEKQP